MCIVGGVLTTRGRVQRLVKSAWLGTGETGLPVMKKILSEPSELPEPEWYLEQFRSHVGAIAELFKAWAAFQESLP